METAATNTALATGLTTMTNKAKGFIVQKVDSTNRDKVLSGAKFDLLDSNGVRLYVQNGIILTADQVKTIIGSDTITPEALNNNGIDSVLTLGEIELCGYTINSVYRLSELNAPDGYVVTNKNVYFKIVVVNNQVVVKITDSSGAEISASSDAVANGNVLKILNTPGQALPQTGGQGTYKFYVLGSLLVAGALAYEYSLRRRERRIK